MACNVGGIERSVRVGVGVLAILIGALADLSSVGMTIAFVVGAVALVTGAIGFCPVWVLLGINTCPASSAKR